MSAPLARLQSWFAAACTHPQGALPGAREHAATLSGAAFDGEDDLERVLTRGPALSALERLQIYNDGYHARLLECLADDYPALAHALGDARFEALGRAYVESHPSRSPSLNAYSAALPRFCRSLREPWALFASELAELEWALVEAVHAPRAEPLDARALAERPPEAWASARLVPSETLGLHRFHYAVNAHYQAFRDGEEPGLPAFAEMPGSAVAVYREGLSLVRLDLEPLAAELLGELMRGTPLGTALQSVAARLTDPDDVDRLQRSLARWFSTWIASGLFTAVV